MESDNLVAGSGEVEESRDGLMWVERSLGRWLREGRTFVLFLAEWWRIFF